MQTIVQIQEPPHRRAPLPRFALWQLGFRPFYLLASLFAAGSVALWALQMSGLVAHAWLSGPLWHAHEMLFGFATAVIVGFLFTAGSSWSGQPTPKGWPLAALAALWLAGRILVLTPWALAAAVAGVAFPVLAAAALGRALVAGGSRRNYFFVVVLVALAAASAAVHLSRAGLLSLPEWIGIRIGLDLVLFVIAVMAGRVTPMFTNNGVRGAGAVRHPWVERASLGGTLLILGADLAGVDGVPLAVLLGVVAVAHAGRLALWRPQRTLRTPLVWVLHVAYAWIPVHLLLRAAAEAGWIAPALATHALTIGAIGMITIGMMTRTARGHTGRPLVADRFEVACYLLVLLSAIVRVLGPMAAPEAYLATVMLSAGAWTAGWALYAIRYWPVLTRPRLDGRPG